jgi:hypothetical protein
MFSGGNGQIDATNKLNVTIKQPLIDFNRDNISKVTVAQRHEKKQNLLSQLANLHNQLTGSFLLLDLRVAEMVIRLALKSSPELETNYLDRQI